MMSHEYCTCSRRDHGTHFKLTTDRRSSVGMCCRFVLLLTISTHVVGRVMDTSLLPEPVCAQLRICSCVVYMWPGHSHHVSSADVLA
jgi:hypothetical protein